jgi:hypothetical protein
VINEGDVNAFWRYVKRLGINRSIVRPRRRPGNALPSEAQKVSEPFVHRLSIRESRTIKRGDPGRAEWALIGWGLTRTGAGNGKTEQRDADRRDDRLPLIGSLSLGDAHAFYRQLNEDRYGDRKGLAY